MLQKVECGGLGELEYGGDRMSENETNEMLYYLKRIADAVSYSPDTQVISMSENLGMINNNLERIAIALESIAGDVAYAMEKAEEESLR